MPVLLDTPIVKHTVVHQAIKEVVFTFSYIVNGGELRINPAEFNLRCDYGSYGDTGNKLEKTATSNIRWVDLPQAGKDMIKSLYQWLETKGETDGIIAAGTKNDPEPL